MTFARGRDGNDDAEVRWTQAQVKWRVEHAQILVSFESGRRGRERGILTRRGLQRLEDIERMGRLGIIASFQPTHGKLAGQSSSLEEGLLTVELASSDQRHGLRGAANRIRPHQGRVRVAQSYRVRLLLHAVLSLRLTSL